MALFDDLGKKVGTFAQNTVQKSKELAEITKINFQISSEEDKIKKNYAEIGKIFYEESGASATGRNGELCALITASLETIKGLREKINDAKNIYICSKCGNEVPDTSKFCNNCGTPAPVDATSFESAATKKICTSCNAEINEGSAFCQNCGAKAE